MNKRLRNHVALWGVIACGVAAWGAGITLVSQGSKTAPYVPLWGFPIIWLVVCALASTVILLIDWGTAP